LPVAPLGRVLIHDPQQEFRTQALLRMDREVRPAQIVQRFFLRWQLETTYAEARAHLGIEPSGKGSSILNPGS